MKPAPFDYFAPRSLDEALALLAKYGSDARPLAGGQTLVQQMNLREVSPKVIIDLNHVPELEGVHVAADGMEIGAMTRQQRLVDDERIRSAHHALAATARAVAFPAVRSRGTLGGSVANAEPGAQLPLLLAMINAQAIIARQGGQRAELVGSLITGARSTTLTPDELLIALRLPPLAPASGFALREFRRGHAGPPLVTVLALVELDAAGTIRAARLGITGATDVPVRLLDEEALLVGQSITSDAVASVAEMAAGRANLGDPVLADVALRRRATRGLLARAIADAAAEAATRGTMEAGT